MNTINKLSFLLGTCFFLCLSACHDAGDYAEEIEDGKLVLSYQVDGGMQASTYALAAETHECRIDDVYILFFRASSHATNPNVYVDYTRIGVAASTPTGNERVTLPMGEDVNDEWQLLILANFDANTFLDGETSVDNFFANKVASKTYSDARQYLMGSFDQDTGMDAPLAMAASFTKVASTNLANITFKRRVARIDVSNSAGNFIFETVQIWNARTHGYLFDQGGSYVSGSSSGDFCNYDAQVVNATADVAQAELYAFPNFVVTPGIRDHETTCLIIGGKYNGSATTTYYRVNVCPASGQQALKANSAYTINITNVTAAGEADPNDAYENSQLNIDYTLNQWDDSFLGTYVFDKDGNGLAVSQRTVIFSQKGEQTVELEVFTIQSGTSPIAGSWTVGAPQGVDAASFSSQKVATPADRYLTVTTKNDNETLTDRTAVVNVSWGTINLPVSLTQLDLNSSTTGIKATPSDLWFSAIGGTKEICVNLQGNFPGATRADLSTGILYKGLESGWLALSAGSTADVPSSGLFYYTLTASALVSSVRDADIKFVLTKGGVVSTAQVSVTQTTIGDSYIRQSTMYMLEKSGHYSYINRGVLTDHYLKTLGLPSAQSTPNHLHFALISHDQIKYKMNIHSSVGWKIVAPGYAGSRLNFSMTEDPGDAQNMRTIEITATADYLTGWDGEFTVEYDDGYKEMFEVHQRGVLATLEKYANGAVDGKMYYYETFYMNGRLWLDRNIGASVGQEGTKGFYSTLDTGIPSDPNAQGFPFARAYAAAACPAGFRMPTYDEWKWVYDTMVWSTALGNESSGGVPYRFVWYITYSSSPDDEKWYIPHAYRGRDAYYWADDKGFLHINARYGEKNLYTLDNAGGELPIRCIQSN